MNPIQVFKPNYTPYIIDILKEINASLVSGWTGLGSTTARFEPAFASRYLPSKVYCTATNSATAALHMAVRSLHLPVGSKVLTTPLTFVSTNAVLLYEHLIPVFMDIDPFTGNIDVWDIESTIKKHDIKAIMLVHFAGYPNDLDEINTIAAQYGIPIIEDCAHSCGAVYFNKYIGDSNNTCCFSFHSVKNLPCGDGGMITTKDPKLHEYFQRMRWLGIDKSTFNRSTNTQYSWEYDLPELGFKYHMSDIYACIGLVMLQHLDTDNARRKEIATYYMENLDESVCIKPMYKRNRTSSYHFLPLLFEERDQVIQSLHNNAINPSSHYKLNTNYKPFQEFPVINNLKNARWFEARELTLPLHTCLTDEEVKKIVEVVNANCCK